MDFENLLEADYSRIIVITCIIVAIGFTIGIFTHDTVIKNYYTERALCLGMLQHDSKTGKLEVSDKKDFSKMDYMYLLEDIREDGYNVFISGCNK